MNEIIDNRSSLGSKSIADILTEKGVDTKPLENGRKDKEGILNDARQVYAMRKAAKLSQAELAELAGMSQSDISRIEQGKGTEGPSVKTLRRLASACGFELGIQLMPKKAPEELEAPLEEANKYLLLIEALFSSIYKTTKNPVSPTEVAVATKSIGLAGTSIGLSLGAIAAPLAAVWLGYNGYKGASKSIITHAKNTPPRMRIALCKDDELIADSVADFPLDKISNDQFKKYIKLLEEAS